MVARVADRSEPNATTVERLLAFYAESARYKTSHISGATFSASSGDCVTDMYVRVSMPSISAAPSSLSSRARAADSVSTSSAWP